jgi:RNA polymerase sigma-70 factor, ECF subfamily
MRMLAVFQLARIYKVFTTSQRPAGPSTPILRVMALHAAPLAPLAVIPTDWRDLSDEALIDSYRQGWGPRTREEAADELFLRHQRRITRWCMRFTRDRESASDLAQEILLRAYRNLDKYRGDCRFSTWLYVIARNCCLTAVQRRASEPVWIAKSQSTELPDTAANNIHETFEMEESRRGNWRFILDTLDALEARVMLLHYGQELPLNDVSRILGLTNKSGAKAYIVSARRKLDAAMRHLTPGAAPETARPTRTAPATNRLHATTPSSATKPTLVPLRSPSPR